MALRFTRKTCKFIVKTRKVRKVYFVEFEFEAIITVFDDLNMDLNF